MAHYAQLDQNNNVIQVVVIDTNDTLNSQGIEDEIVGINFCKQLYGSDTIWKRTSYNNNIRVRYAGIGMIYNEELDAFIYPQPYPSWTLNKDTADWEAPIPRPELSKEELDNKFYYEWNEDTKNWILLKLE
jgi:hypothetical protein